MLFTSLVPRRLSFAVAGAMGYSAYYLMPLRRRIAKENFAHVLGSSPDDPSVRRVARESFRNYARLLRDVMIYPRTPLDELQQRVSIHNKEYFEQALAHGRGAIVVSAHFGNMDMASAVLAKEFKPFTLVAETLRPQQLMDFLTRIRKERNVRLFSYERAPRKIIEALKRNELTAFLLDFGVTHHFDITTVPVTFFGTLTDFPAGPAQLALLTNTPIIVGHSHVAADGHIDIFATPPMFIERTGDRRHMMQVTMQAIACHMENFIRLYPEQWYMFRPMWKDRAKDTHPVTL